MEEWKLLERIPHYEVSNTGRVRSLRFNKQKLLKACETKDGYMLYCLANNRKRYTSYAHRLVAEVFLPEPGLLQTEVNHKDKNRQNNIVDNLEWTSPAENHFHRDNPKLYDLCKICFNLDDNQMDDVLKFAKSLGN
jgi:hypothetical protein